MAQQGTTALDVLGAFPSGFNLEILYLEVVPRPHARSSSRQPGSFARYEGRQRQPTAVSSRRALRTCVPCSEGSFETARLHAVVVVATGATFDLLGSVIVHVSVKVIHLEIVVGL